MYDTFIVKFAAMKERVSLKFCKISSVVFGSELRNEEKSATSASKTLMTFQSSVIFQKAVHFFLNKKTTAIAILHIAQNANAHKNDREVEVRSCA